MIFCILIVVVYLVYNHFTNISDDKGKLLYAECYEKYQETYTKLTKGINQKNVQEKVATLYNDDNKQLITDMGIILDEYDDKLVNYADYYIVFFDLKESYNKLKTDFYKLERWDELSYIEQLEVRVSFLLNDY
jgi:hypothetical protein